jgi:CMP-N,N'-diacetyllegionaminic acid synthase
MSVLCIIPARKGSKGIPNKNIADVAGIPLIAHSINIAMKLKEYEYVSDVIVSTDGDEIAAISKNYGASVPFLRPDELSTDTSKSIDFILHALEWMYKFEGKSFEWVLLLQPTSPLRMMSDFEFAFEKIKTNHSSNSLISVYKEEYINDLVMYKNDGVSPALKPLNILHNKGVRRQDHGFTYVRSGSIYMTKVEYLHNSKQIICDSPLFVEIPKRRSINVDTQEDLIELRNFFDE